MAFTDGCSCHVWAIDGWVNDALSQEVNTNYANAGTAIATGGVPNTGTLNQKVAYLGQHCRVSPAKAPAAQGILYGGFQHAGDGSPEHMWFEYNGYIYDTMPGSPLRRIAATAATRLQPPSEGHAFAANMVGSTPFQLTEPQFRLTQGVGGVAPAWQNGNLGGRAIQYYTP